MIRTSSRPRRLRALLVAAALSVSMFGTALPAAAANQTAIERAPSVEGDGFAPQGWVWTRSSEFTPRGWVWTRSSEFTPRGWVWTRSSEFTPRGWVWTRSSEFTPRGWVWT
jgi:hypothetical protein